MLAILNKRKIFTHIINPSISLSFSHNLTTQLVSIKHRVPFIQRRSLFANDRKVTFTLITPTLMRVGES